MFVPDISLVGIALAVLFVAVALAEQARPRWVPIVAARSRWCVNLSLYALSAAFRLALAPAIAAVAVLVVDPVVPAPETSFAMGVHMAAAVLGIDLAYYAVHRALHGVAWLWRIHVVHHSDLDLDVTTAVRNHPLEALPLTAVAVIAGWLGATPAESALYGLLAFTVQLIAHANLALPAWAESPLSWIVVTPSFHALHHSRDARDFNTNYGEAFAIWDHLFGTAARASMPLSFGVDGFTEPCDQTVSAALLQPLHVPAAPLP